MAQRWMAKSQKMVTEHERAAQWYREGHVYLGILTTMLCATVSTTIIGTTAAQEGTWSDYLNFFSGGIAALSACTSGISRFLDWSTVSQHHAAACIVYEKIAKKLELELSFPARDRREARKFLNEVREDLATARKTCALVTIETEDHTDINCTIRDRTQHSSPSSSDSDESEDNLRFADDAEGEEMERDVGDQPSTPGTHPTDNISEMGTAAPSSFSEYLVPDAKNKLEKEIQIEIRAIRRKHLDKAEQYQMRRLFSCGSLMRSERK